VSDVNGMIKEVITTTAKESDIKQLDKLTENEKSFVFAKSLSKEKKKSLRKKEIFDGIIERKVKSQKKLRTKQKKIIKNLLKLKP
jgi:IS5 family transposase